MSETLSPMFDGTKQNFFVTCHKHGVILAASRGTIIDGDRKCRQVTVIGTKSISEGSKCHIDCVMLSGSRQPNTS